jgi:hypothetical protein
LPFYKENKLSAVIREDPLLRSPEGISVNKLLICSTKKASPTLGEKAQKVVK